MSVTKAILRREWRLTRVPVVLATMLSVVVLLATNSRTYDRLFEAPQPYIPVLIAAWLGYRRVYQEHVRGTWLLLPIARGRHAILKTSFFLALLLLHASINAIAIYAWVSTHPAPGGPIPSPLQFVAIWTSQQLAASFAVLVAAWVAAFETSLLPRIVWAASSVAIVLGTALTKRAYREVGPDVLPSFEASTMVALVLLTVLGASLVRSETLRVGGPTSARLDILRAAWVLPFAAVALAAIADLTFDHHKPSRPWEEFVAFPDGEVTVLTGEITTGLHGRHQNGEAIFFPILPSNRTDLRFAQNNRRLPIFGEGVGSDLENLFISEDQRHVQIFDGVSRKWVACWGEEGVIRGHTCTPFKQPILSLTQRFVARSGERIPTFTGIQLITQDRYLERDQSGNVKERFRGDNIVDVVELESGESAVIFTQSKTHIIGAHERTCPATASGKVAFLADGTLVVKTAPPSSANGNSWMATATFCSTKGDLRSVSLPLKTERPFRLASILMLPRHYGDAPVSARWIAGALRLLGVLVLSIVWRRRGLIVALPGLVFGPAYFFAAALTMTDLSTLGARVKARFDGFGSMRGAT